MSMPEKMETSSDQSASIQKMVYGISHDMSAPLRAVVQLSQMLKLRLGDRLDEKESYWLQLIEESGCQGQRMIEALLTFSRLTTHRQAESTFLLQQTLQKAISGLEIQFKDQSVSIQVEGDWPEFTGCEAQCLLLFSSLIHNALLYQPESSNHKAEVVVCCQQVDEDGSKQLRITVEDNGIGVRENMWSVLTTPFKRLQSEQDYPGIGMGLTYCEQIAELHGGSLSFSQSSLGGLSVSCLVKAN